MGQNLGEILSRKNIKCLWHESDGFPQNLLFISNCFDKIPKMMTKNNKKQLYTVFVYPETSEVKRILHDNDNI